MNIVGVSTIEDVLCFFISIQRTVEGLYGAWYRANASQGRGFLYNFTFLNLGTLGLFGQKILLLESAARCASLQDLVNGATTLEGMAKLLFKIRPALSALYAAYIQSQAQRNDGLKFCYLFNNPLAGTTAFGGNITGSVRLNNCNFNEFINRCRCTTFQVAL